MGPVSVRIYPLLVGALFPSVCLQVTRPLSRDEGFAMSETDPQRNELQAQRAAKDVAQRHVHGERRQKQEGEGNNKG